LPLNAAQVYYLEFEILNLADLKKTQIEQTLGKKEMPLRIV